MKGASRRSGPAPDPNALKRDRDSQHWVTLPAEGRQGPAPEWPLKDQTQREVELWASEWARPQAVEWERNGQEVEVALYIRALTDAEGHEAPVTARTLVRQLQEALGISLPGLQRNQWKIAGSLTAVADAQSVAPAKSKFKVVAGGLE